MTSDGPSLQASSSRRSSAAPRFKTRSTPKKTKTPVREPEDDVWYRIKDIVDERYEKRKLQYLIDWANNEITGEAYPKSWVSFCGLV